MKTWEVSKIGLFAVLILLWPESGAAKSEERVFTDKQGREIIAQLVSGTSKNVTIVMKGGKTYTLPIARFVAEDQKFIRDWIKENPAAINYRFDIKDEKKRTSRETRRGDDTDITEESWHYKLSIRNSSGADIDKLEVRYRIYKSTPAGGKSRKVSISTHDGASSFGDVVIGRELQIQTKEISLIETKLDGGFYYTDGSKSKMGQELEGIWVKLFHNGKKVWDYQAGKSSVKKATWADEDALAANDSSG